MYLFFSFGNIRQLSVCHVSSVLIATLLVLVLEQLLQPHMSYQPLLVSLSLPAFWPLEMTAVSVLEPARPVFPISTAGTLSSMHSDYPYS